jgi:anhydro-N-acetylmuramic acid kinase
MPTRTLIGLAIGSGFEAADAAAIRVEGVGLGMSPRVLATARVMLPAELRGVRQADRARDLGESLAVAARQTADRLGLNWRDVLALGLLAPPETPFDIAEWLAEQTGLTVVSGFRSRDIAAGGGGQLVTAAADALLFRDALQERVLVHLGSATSILLIPPGGKLSELIGFEAGPGSHLLDELITLGTRGRETCDHGGTRAVQGRCLEAVLNRWLAHPFLLRKPPKALPGAAFGTPFLTDAFKSAKSHGATLPDLLCTATHFVARCVGVGCEQWLPPAGAERRVFVSGGGTRNGFLWKLLGQQFPGQPVGRLDELDVPATARTAAGGAVLTALALDGVAANLPLVTGAAGGRLIGRFIPGDPRNWAACTAWMAEQLADYPTFPRAA